MKIVAFVPADRDEICFGLLEGERIEVIEDPFATGEVTRTASRGRMWCSSTRAFHPRRCVSA